MKLPEVLPKPLKNPSACKPSNRTTQIQVDHSANGRVNLGPGHRLLGFYFTNLQFRVNISSWTPYLVLLICLFGMTLQTKKISDLESKLDRMDEQLDRLGQKLKLVEIERKAPEPEPEKSQRRSSRTRRSINPNSSQKLLLKTARKSNDSLAFSELQLQYHSFDAKANASDTARGNRRIRMKGKARKVLASQRLQLLREDNLRLHQLLEEEKLSLRKLRLKLRTLKALAKERKLKLLHSSRSTDSESRALILKPLYDFIDIQHQKQVIGPWAIDDGPRFGFMDRWYTNISLDAYQSVVLFQESGLYLIFAQIYYKSDPDQTYKNRCGFKMYLKKQYESDQGQPFSVAECVSAFPTRFQTCFTQMVWFLEPGDGLYLEHFTDATPSIEARELGQSFVAIVRL